MYVTVCLVGERIFTSTASVPSRGLCTDMKFLLQSPPPFHHAFFNSLRPLQTIFPTFSTYCHSPPCFFDPLFFSPFSAYFPLSPSRCRLHHHLVIAYWSVMLAGNGAFLCFFCEIVYKYFFVVVSQTLPSTLPISLPPPLQPPLLCAHTSIPLATLSYKHKHTHIHPKFPYYHNNNHFDKSLHVLTSSRSFISAEMRQMI